MARRRLRPPGRQINCPLDALSWDSREVRRATRLADEKRIAMLRITVPAAEQEAALAAVARLAEQVDGGRRLALAAVIRVTQQDGSRAVTLELLLTGRGEDAGGGAR